MEERQEFVIYLSSTLKDLVDERELAIRTIAEVGRVKTSYRADENGTPAACTADVREAHLYVGLVGQRYGFVPPVDDGNPQGKSITELEYEACEKSVRGEPVPRLVFLKSFKAGIDEQFIDAVSNLDTAKRMRDFIARTRREQQPFEYESIDALRAEIRIRIHEHAERFHAQQRGPTALGTEKVWRRKLVPVAVGCAPGTDDASLNAVQDARDPRFTAFELSAEDPAYLATLDAAAAGAQHCLLLVTPASLSRSASGPGVAAVAQGLAMLQARTGRATLLCEGVREADLPPAWRIAQAIELPAGALSQDPSALSALHARLRAGDASLTLEPRLAVPFMVVAPTRDEALELVQHPDEVFGRYPGAGTRLLRQAEFRSMEKVARQADPTWPDGVYGQRRDDWRCFGRDQPTVVELLEASIARINDAAAGSRERRLLKSARLVTRRYGFDEMAHDVLGSRRAVTRVRSSCLLIVDELALLHPALREQLDDLLAGAGNAVVVVTPCDPAHASTRELLEDASFVRIGSLVQRFLNERDPRCEIAVNSLARLERWLAATLPELVAATDEGEARGTLLDRMNGRLA